MSYINNYKRLNSPLFSYNVYIIKKYKNKIKFILLKSLRSDGVKSPLSKRGDILLKLENNLSRAKSTIYELSICNDWEYFITMTISPDKYDRTNLKKYYKDLSKFLNNYNYQNNCNIKYLLIPELHKDGKSWHIHGLMYNIPIEKLKINDNGFLDWEDYSKKFGYISLSKIKDIEKTSLYITKYITKSTKETTIDLNNHLFYSSQNLKRAEKIFQGHIYNISPDLKYDFTNDYLSIKNTNEIELNEILKDCELIKC